MFRTKRAIISPIWTHSCQRSNDLCLLSPVARLSGGLRRTGRTPCVEPTLTLALSRGVSRQRGRVGAAEPNVSVRITRNRTEQTKSECTK
jgi:hypothetical protein